MTFFFFLCDSPNYHLLEKLDISSRDLKQEYHQRNRICVRQLGDHSNNHNNHNLLKEYYIDIILNTL